MRREDFPIDFSGLVFDEARHVYTVNGEVYESVTSLLAREADFREDTVIDKIIRMPNSVYYNASPAEIKEYWRFTAERGTEYHSTVEKWLTGETKRHQHQNWFLANGISPVDTFTEIRVYSTTLKISGTIDLVKIDHKEKTIVVSDLKTSRKIDEKKFLSFNKQVLYYCWVLKFRLAETKSPLSEYTIRPGGIIHVQPANDFLQNRHSAEMRTPTFIPLGNTIIEELVIEEIIERLK